MKATARPAKPKKPAAKARRAVKVLPKVFTVRDMNRNTQTVLRAARQHGRVMIRGRSGEQFKVEPMSPDDHAGPRPDFVERMRLHHERMKSLGVVGPKAIDVERLNRIIAGEE